MLEIAWIAIGIVTVFCAVMSVLAVIEDTKGQ